jgi:uncharacterized protein (DUF433 family)
MMETSANVTGIVFTDGPAGLRATIVGTGLDVWEVIATWKEAGEQWDALRKSYDWLTDDQLRSALAYYQTSPGEIDARLAVEQQWSPTRVASELPHLSPWHML